MIQISFNIQTASPAWKKAFPKMRGKIEQAAAVAFLRAKKPVKLKKGAFEINILLTDDAAMKKLNRDFRGKNKATNVLSFPAGAMPGPSGRLFLGDIALGFQTLRKESRDQKKTLESHVLHLVVHGVLHLLGYDHMLKKDAKNMETLECDILATLGYPDPYHDVVAKKGRALK